MGIMFSKDTQITGANFKASLRSTWENHEGENSEFCLMNFHR